MANMTVTPTDWSDAYAALKGKSSRTIGNNTVLCWSGNVSPRDGGSIDVRLHGNTIVTFFLNGQVEYTNAGWPSVTTRDRLNQFARPGMRFAQRKGEQVYTIDGGKTWQRFNGYVIV